MATLVLLEAVAIALLGVLVVGLLRSHAEILRKLHALGLGEAPEGGRETPVAPPRGRPAGEEVARRPAADLVGTGPRGEAVQVGVRGTRHDTLVAFLSTGCTTCAEFWRAFDRPEAAVGLPPGTRLVVVTKDPEAESLSRVRALAPPEAPVVMSSEAWEAYEVPVTPFFVHVDGPSGRVVGQGAGSTWAQVLSLIVQAGRDDRPARTGTGPAQPGGEAGVDQKLLAAGLRPDDPSLWPSRARP